MSLRKSPRLTPQLLAAARQNAQHATGPRSPAAKQNSKLNALKQIGNPSSCGLTWTPSYAGVTTTHENEKLSERSGNVTENKGSVLRAPSGTGPGRACPTLADEQGGFRLGSLACRFQGTASRPPTMASCRAYKKLIERSGNVTENKGVLFLASADPRFWGPRVFQENERTMQECH